MRLAQPKIPDTRAGHFDASLSDAFAKIIEQINALSEGRIVAYLSSASAPTFAGSADQIVMRSGRVIAGSPGSRYVVIGWQYISGAWVEMRTLTGT